MTTPKSPPSAAVPPVAPPVAPIAPGPTGQVPRVPRTLDDLAALTAAALDTLYAQATTPSIPEVTGDLRGRMLAINYLDRGWLARALRAFAAWRFFPWRGKSFVALGANLGEGINRVFSERRPRRWFRFETRIAPSRAGAFNAFHLDYDNPGNPFFIRAIKDEIRRVAPGLYLGQAYLMLRGRARLVLYFGLAAPKGQTEG